MLQSIATAALHPPPPASLRARRHRSMGTPSPCAASSDFQVQTTPGCTEPLSQAIKVVGMGSSGQDLLAQVAAFPSPDDKLRTEKFETQGGGNCGNALTAAARLGLAPAIVSKIGDDAVGDAIVAEFEREGIDTAHLLRAQGAPSPFTYIIVDRQGGTRTCIHTPGEPMVPQELTPELADAVLQGAAAVYFDGRLTEAALVLAAAARQRGVPVLVEAERLRPGLEQLLEFADYVVSSAHFPQGWTGEQCLGDALVETFSRLPRIKWLVTTLGSRGSVLLEREEAAEVVGAAGLEALLPQLFEQAAAMHGEAPQLAPACTSPSGVAIQIGGSASTSGVMSLRMQRSEAESQRVMEAATAAAFAAAAANADTGNAAGYAMRSPWPRYGSSSSSSSSGGNTREEASGEVCARVTAMRAAQLPPGAVVDTTGAGDAFIGAILYGLASGMPVQRAMQLASVVAACKCTALGPRPGLPRRSNLAASLLGC